jgi:hypothetical protein
MSLHHAKTDEAPTNRAEGKCFGHKTKIYNMSPGYVSDTSRTYSLLLLGAWQLALSNISPTSKTS